MPAHKIQDLELYERQRIGATLREFREARGFKPDDLANAVGISRPYLVNIEAGRKPLTKVLLGRFSRALNVRQVAIVRANYFTADELSA